MESLSLEDEMALPVLQKLNLEERKEFIRLYHTVPHKLSEEDDKRLDELSKRVDLQQLHFETWREYARKPTEVSCKIHRDPYILRTGIYGDLILPDELVPDELKELPGEDYYKNMIRAQITADLVTCDHEDNISGVVTSFIFERYFKIMTEEELEQLYYPSD